LLQTVPFSRLKPFNLTLTFGYIMYCSLSDSSWCQASLLFRYGGLGLHESVPSASATVYTFRISANDLDSIFLSVDDQLNFPDEEAAATVFF